MIGVAQKRALVLYPAGTVQMIHVPGGNTDAELTKLRELVGGYVESPLIRDDLVGRASLWIDEEGKLKAKPANPCASIVYRYGHRDPIVGTAVVLGGIDPAGDTTSLGCCEAHEILRRIGVPEPDLDRVFGGSLVSTEHHLEAWVDEEERAAVDAMSVEELLRSVRFTAPGAPEFQGARGQYRLRRLGQLRDSDQAAYVAASKSIGWGRGS